MSRTRLLSEAISRIEAEAYQRGFTDALRAVAAAVRDLRPQVIARETDLSQPQLSIGTTRRRLRGNSDQARVLDAIRNQPGLRGIEIVRTLEGSGNPIPERTVRTALSRLRKSGLITQKEERWYAVETGQTV